MTVKRETMKIVMAILTVAAVLAVCPAWAKAPIAQPKTIEIDKFTCKDLMSGNDADREVGIAFFHGFMAGRQNGQTFDLLMASDITDKVKDYCLSNPTATVMDAFKQAGK